MASQNKIIEMIGAIKTIYSYYARDTDVGMLVKTWKLLLKDYDDAVVEMAFYKCLQTCKMPPTPADVIEQITAMESTTKQSDEELWSIYCRSLEDAMRLIHRFHDTYVDESGISQGEMAKNKFDMLWISLPEKIKRYLASKGEFERMARDKNNSDGEFLKWEKQRFLKNMPIMEKREQYSSFLLERGDNQFLLEQKKGYIDEY